MSLRIKGVRAVRLGMKRVKQRGRVGYGSHKMEEKIRDWEGVSVE